MRYGNVYVAASSQHVGKTTNTLGMVSIFRQLGLSVGYCKPVGQKFLELDHKYVDKDTLLFADLIEFDIVPEYHSPVVLPSQRVRDLIMEPQEMHLEKKIAVARDYLNEKCDLTIFEGTGHPGVGSVAGLSNAKVAKLLNAGVVMILEGGIGSTIDMFHMCTAVFREENVPILGAVVNKVKPDRMDYIRQYLQQWMEDNGVPLLGLIPYDEALAYPLMSAVADSIKGTVELNDDRLDNRVENMLAGSLIDLKELKSFQNLLLIASNRTIQRAIKKIESFSALMNEGQCPLAGIIVTGKGSIEADSMNYIIENRLPLIRTNFDTYGAMLKISRIEVKINRHTPWKIKRAIELIKDNVNLDQILRPV